MNQKSFFGRSPYPALADPLFSTTKEAAMSLADDFPEITKRNAPLAPFTHLKIGGPAEFLIQPRTVDELPRGPDRVPEATTCRCGCSAAATTCSSATIPFPARSCG